MTNQAACMAAATALSVHVEQKGRFRPSRSRLGAVSPAASAAVTAEPRSAESASGMVCRGEKRDAKRDGPQARATKHTRRARRCLKRSSLSSVFSVVRSEETKRYH